MAHFPSDVKAACLALYKDSKCVYADFTRRLGCKPPCESSIKKWLHQETAPPKRIGRPSLIEEAVVRLAIEVLDGEHRLSPKELRDYLVALPAYAPIVKKITTKHYVGSRGCTLGRW